MTGPREIFDLDLLARRRDRAMTLGFAGGADFLHRLAADMLAERMLDVPRPFERIVLAGTGAGALADAVRPGGAGLTQLEPSPAMARLAAERAPAADTRVVPGEDLGLEAGHYDLALSALTLHHLNDPVGHLVQLRQALKPDGLLLAAAFGGQTLAELRAALAEAETEVTGGLSPRVAPMGEIRDLGSLIGRAGLALPVADAERLSVSYETPLHLMRELRAMGEGNILHDRRRVPARRALLTRAAQIYAESFSEPSGRVRATFEIVFLTGWAPGPGQPVAKRPGSATHRLADALGTFEMPTGVKPGP